MHPRAVKILGTGKHLPARAVTAADLDRQLGLEDGTVAKRSGVLTRHWVTDETTSEMGARAAFNALEAAGLNFEDVDAIVGVSGTQEQAIPCTAALIQKAMGFEDSGVPCFDINSTCLSFLTGLDVVSYMVEAGRFRRVLLVSSEIASVGLDWNEFESATILGDGAAAAVVGLAADDSAILLSRMETYSSGAALTQTKGGGTRYHPRKHEGDLASYTEAYALFEMDGKAVFKLSANVLPGFVARMFEGSPYSLDQVKLVVPHQASPTALWLMQRRLGIPEDKWMVIAHDHGNTIAASIPLALHEAVAQGRLDRGDMVMLLGTSAGLSVGAMLLRY